MGRNSIGVMGVKLPPQRSVITDFFLIVTFVQNLKCLVCSEGPIYCIEVL